VKVVAISNPDGAADLLTKARSNGYITFVYHHADPLGELLSNKFLYVSSDDELMEKLTLLRQDAAVVDEVARW
jgi:hypothetical protein